MADNRPIVYWDSSIDRWVYRASSIGRSLRCLSAARQGATPLPAPQYLLDAAEAGNLAEPVVKQMLRDRGYKVFGEQAYFDLAVNDTAVIRGHLDSGHCKDPDGTDRILEVKSMSPRVFATWMKWNFERFPTYAAQLSIYMHAAAQILRGVTSVEATYAALNRETGELDIRTITEPPIPPRKLLEKVMLVEFYAEDDSMPKCDSASEYSCPYEYLCDKREFIFAEPEAGTEELFADLAAQYAEIKAMSDELKSRSVEIRGKLVEAMGDREHVEIPGWSFTNKIPKPTRKLDEVALRAELGDGLDKFYRETEKDEPVLYVRRRST